MSALRRYFHDMVAAMNIVPTKSNQNLGISDIGSGLFRFRTGITRWGFSGSYFGRIKIISLHDLEMIEVDFGHILGGAENFL